ncbi:hypothetical protein [Actinoallomurus rhizosphaericola]|uniref:hypothetical protein n=1 Tax=Actinoallomurus rhizosphaericola TaxID=2952536 RepID=UPI0020923956|nr:hypothetical protein [Actinoallomurus rhizosphaericola]MCO5996349.1 hypothetical protein [Actinoallomurus rhizosphaericola]
MRVTRLLPLPIAIAALALTTAGPAFAVAKSSPKPRTTIGTAGTSFLTATTVKPGQSVRLSASTGDYLYWSFAAAAGQTDRIAVTVALPTDSARLGTATWNVDVFDGLRRRQACTAGPQTVTAQSGAAKVALQCTLRQIRSWAEPWSSDPLPGTYYVRLSATDLPEQGLGLPIDVRLRISAKHGNAEPQGAHLKAPLSPAVNPGATLAPDAAPSVEPSAVSSAPKPLQRARSWFSWPSTRWWWTIGGGVLAAVAGVAGYSLTRHPHRWFS